MKPNKELFQYDINQSLSGCTGTHIDFIIGGDVFRVQVENETCLIPDELLQVEGDHTVYQTYEDGTMSEHRLFVYGRPKPAGYIYTPTEKLTFDGLVKRVDDAVADMIRRAESGEFDGHTPVKGTDYFTTEEIQQIQNEVSSGAIF